MEYDLEKYVTAHEQDYERALAEIKNGRKETHWMWYIFPQMAGLGRSYIAQMYAINSLDEAKAYYAHPVLGAHLREISEALLLLDINDATKIMGRPDDMKLRSSMTLFANAAPECDVFQKVLDKYFDGKYDFRTLDLL